MISGIINTKDRVLPLCECVKSILAQQHPIGELIIVDASQNTHEIKERVRRLLSNSKIALKFIHTKAGNSYQRNIGISMLDPSSEYVCFFDDDVVLFPDTIDSYIKKFTEYADIGAVQGIETNRKPQHFLGKIVRRFFYIGYEGGLWRLLPSGEHVMVIHPSKDQYIGSLMIGLSCIKRSILNSFRFDEWFKSYAFLEDYDFSYRLGKKCKLLISPEVRLIHNRNTFTRLNTFKTSEMFIINKTYFFLKNIDKAIWRTLAFIWSLAGHVVLNLGKSIHYRDMGYVCGTCNGIIKLLYLKKIRK